MTDSNSDDRFAEFPEPIRKAIQDSNWQLKLRGIVSKYHLRIDQGSILEDETLALLDGSQSVEEYAVHLATLLKLNEADLRSMAADLERDVFAPIQKSIQALAGEDFEGGHVGVSGVGEAEEDDLEALLNEGDSALAKAASLKPTPAAPTPLPVKSPIVAAAAPFSAPASKPAAQVPPATPPLAPGAPAVSVPLSSAAQKLAAPVVKPVEIVTGNLQKPSAPSSLPATAPTVPPAGHDPYREPVI
jgi:hypothetical protein